MGGEGKERVRDRRVFSHQSEAAAKRMGGEKGEAAQVMPLLRNLAIKEGMEYLGVERVVFLDPQYCSIFV